MNFNGFNMMLIRWVKLLDYSTDFENITDIKARNIALMKEVKALSNKLSELPHLELFFETYQKFSSEVKRNPYVECVNLIVDMSPMSTHMKVMNIKMIIPRAL
jgi:hypothetical protein